MIEGKGVLESGFCWAEVEGVDGWIESGGIVVDFRGVCSEFSGGLRMVDEKEDERWIGRYRYLVQESISLSLK